LRVLDSEPVIRGRNRGQCRLVGVEYGAVPAVTDRVRIDLKPCTERPRRHLLDMRRWRDVETGVPGIVAVRLEAHGAARAHRPVDVELPAPDPEHAAIEPAL